MQKENNNPHNIKVDDIVHVGHIAKDIPYLVFATTCKVTCVSKYHFGVDILGYTDFELATLKSVIKKDNAPLAICFKTYEEAATWASEVNTLFELQQTVSKLNYEKIDIDRVYKIQKILGTH